MRRILTRRGLRHIFQAVWKNIKEFFVGVYRHAETITILILASLGLNALLGELPFLFLLPFWIEAVLVIPVISVIAISLLVKSAEWRAKRRIPLTA
ncbi:MAG TPA: hypothetical protein VJ742_12605 [Nitrososphaera sp.]|nr:hypothetical protein [Nitrososphaera sp.]